jgi:crotonobetainyl-CoA:carnitine CoA-transferase CaiB-like acyl-CoA transferase
MVSMPGFGGSGPMRDRTSFGPGIEAMTGLADLTGHQDGPPLKPGNYVTDYNAAMLAAFAVMAALRARRRTGLGRRIEVPLREGALQMIGDKVMDYALMGRVPTRMGNRHSSMAPHGVYPCRGADKWIAIAIASDEDWVALRSAMGDPEWAEDGRYRTAAGRLEHEDDLDIRLAAWTRSQDHIGLMHRLQAAGLDAAACLTTAEVEADPHFRARGFIQQVQIPESGPARYPRYGFQLARTPVHTAAGPAFGAHNRDVLQDLLGMSEEDFAGLAAAFGTSDRPVPPSELQAPRA